VARRGSYQDVIDAAVADLAEHGFSSAERVAYWERKIEEAAKEFLGSTERMTEMLREVLAATYKKMIERGGIAKYHPGVERWTIAKVKPSLRAELDRRILASANLIRLNRREAIAKTLRRFSGWSTSIPVGGSAEPEKAKTRKSIKKPIATLKFEERRVLVDQGHKLVSTLNDIVAKDGGAIGGHWHSNYRQPNYDYREDHKERDGNFYAVRGSWAIEAGLITKGFGYTDEITEPAEEPFCRCRYRYAYNLRDVPKEYLTRKGEAAIEEARAKIKAMA
jgi:hypothetical protein